MLVRGSTLYAVSIRVAIATLLAVTGIGVVVVLCVTTTVGTGFFVVLVLFRVTS